MDQLRPRVLLVDVMAVVFGIGAWISVNGMWVELPLLVQALPEGWALPSYMSVAVQIANIGPILYSIGRFMGPKVVTEVRSIYALMLIGVLSSLLIALFWQKTSLIGGAEHSTALLALLFCLSLVDCTSSVLFMPFMARFRQFYLASYLIGEGLSGFLPSLFALAQGVGGNPECRNGTSRNDSDGQLVTFNLEAYYPEPRFSVMEFFFLLLAMMILSAVAFFALNRTSAARYERVDIAHRQPNRHSSPVDNQTFVSSTDPLPAIVDKSAIIDGCDSHPTVNSAVLVVKEPLDSSRSISPIRMASDASSITDEADHVTHLSKSIFVYLLLIQAWVCALSNGFLPSVQSYSCLPYGNLAYHLAVTLSAMANPVACFIAYFFPIGNIALITVFTFIGTTISSYIVVLAALSPEPPLVNYSSGEALMVIIERLHLICINHCCAPSITKRDL